MKQKVIALFTVMAMVVFVATVMVRDIMGFPILSLVHFLVCALILLIFSIIFAGPLISHVGIEIIEEVIQERRNEREHHMLEGASTTAENSETEQANENAEVNPTPDEG